MAKKKFIIVTNILRYGITNEQCLRSLFLRKHLQGEIRCFGNSKSCGNLICRSVTTGNVLDEEGAMFRVSVAFPLAKMCQLIYYCVSAACSFVQKFCGFQFLVSLSNIKYNIPNKGDETRLRELSLFFLYLEASNPNRFYFFLFI